MGDLTENFSNSEFLCNCGCGAGHISYPLVQHLQKIRDEIGVPLNITSGVRCIEHNAASGGSEDSEHISGNAADIFCINSIFRFEILSATFKIADENFSRVGVHKDFIHIGNSSRKLQNTVWLYG